MACGLTLEAIRTCEYDGRYGREFKDTPDALRDEMAILEAMDDGGE